MITFVVLVLMDMVFRKRVRVIDIITNAFIPAFFIMVGIPDTLGPWVVAVVTGIVLTVLLNIIMILAFPKVSEWVLWEYKKEKKEL